MSGVIFLIFLYLRIFKNTSLSRDLFSQIIYNNLQKTQYLVSSVWMFIQTQFFFIVYVNR